MGPLGIRLKPFGSDLSTKAPPVVLKVDPGGSVDPVELTLLSATNILMKFVYFFRNRRTTTHS